MDEPHNPPFNVDSEFLFKNKSWFGNFPPWLLEKSYTNWKHVVVDGLWVQT